jgi:hypothetical protein
LTIAVSGTLIIVAGKKLRVNAAFSNSGVIHNNGTIESRSISPNNIINNNGTINTVDGGIDGEINNDVDGTVIIGTFDSEGNFTPSLTNSINQINAGETYIVNDDVTVSTFNISSGGTLTISAGKKLKVISTLSNSGDIINNGKIENRSINNNGTITNNGTINTVESGISGNGNGTISGNGTLIIGTFDDSENFTQRFTVTVNGSNKFEIDGEEQDTITLTSGQTYNFDVSHSSNNGHIFRFSTTQDGTHNGGQSYTTDVTVSYNITTIIAPDHNTHDTLYYYCSAHPGMGGEIDIVE